MTWLFTQVWLWSLAAFLLGSVTTWLLFVRPAHRQLRLVREELAEFTHGRYPEELGPDPREHEHEHTMWDVLDADGDEPDPSPDRPFRTSSGEASGYWSLRAGSPWERDTAEDDRPVERTGRPDLAEAPGETAPADDRESARQQVDDSDIRLERQRESGEREAESAVPPPAPVWPQPQPQQPTAPPEVEPAASAATEQHPNRNTWFNDEAVGHESEEQNLTGKLRSLFEPVTGGGSESGDPHAPTSRNAANGAPAQSPPSPPRDSANWPTGRLGAVDSGRAPGEETTRNDVNLADAATESSPLPRRVPGSTSRPGTPPGSRADLEATAEHPAAPGLADGAAGRGWAADGGAAAGGEPVWPGMSESAGASGTPVASVWEWYPDEEYGSQGRPEEGYAVKGHFASRQYHTSESPYFERVAAEVWFSTPAEAEEAGFEPWDGRSRA